MSYPTSHPFVPHHVPSYLSRIAYLLNPSLRIAGYLPITAPSASRDCEPFANSRPSYVSPAYVHIDNATRIRYLPYRPGHELPPSSGAIISDTRSGHLLIRRRRERKGGGGCTFLFRGVARAGRRAISRVELGWNLRMHGNAWLRTSSTYIHTHIHTFVLHRIPRTFHLSPYLPTYLPTIYHIHIHIQAPPHPPSLHAPHLPACPSPNP